MKRMHRFAVGIACAAILGFCPPAFSQYLSDITPDTMSNGTATGQFQGLLITDQADNTNEVSTTSEHFGIRVESRQNVDDYVSIFAGAFQAAAEAQTSGGSNIVNLNGVFGMTGVWRPNGNTNDVKDLRELRGVFGQGFLGSLTNQPNHYTSKVVNSGHMTMYGGDFSVFPQSKEGGANVTGDASIQYAAGAKGLIYFDNNWGGHGEETLGGKVDSAYGGDFQVFMGKNKRGAGNQGLATITNAYGVRAQVEFQDQPDDAYNGAMTDAYGLWAEVKDTDNKISGKKYAIWAKGKTAVKRTVWKDWAAVAKAGGNVAGYGAVEGYTYNEYSIVGWMPLGLTGPVGLSTIGDGACVYFPIEYENGTVLTRLRVKYSSNDSDGGVKVRLVKRNESGTTTGWTVIGAQQTYHASAVTVATYDFTDETVQEGYSYSIEVESDTYQGSETRLYSVGIETSRREY